MFAECLFGLNLDNFEESGDIFVVKHASIEIDLINGHRLSMIFLQGLNSLRGLPCIYPAIPAVKALPKPIVPALFDFHL